MADDDVDLLLHQQGMEWRRAARREPDLHAALGRVVLAGGRSARASQRSAPFRFRWIVAGAAGAAVVLVAVVVVAVVQLGAPDGLSPGPAAPAHLSGLRPNESVGVVRSGGSSRAEVVGRDGKRVRDLAPAVAAIGMTGDRDRVLLQSSEVVAPCGGAAFVLSGVTDGSTAPAFGTSTVSSAAIAGHTVVGLSAGVDGSGCSPARLLVRDLGTAGVRALDLPADAGKHPRVRAVDPDGTWAVIENSDRTDAPVAYVAEIGTASLRFRPVRLLKGCRATSFASFPESDLTVVRICAGKFTVSTYVLQSSAQRLVYTDEHALADNGPGTQVDIAWSQVGDGLVQITDRDSAPSTYLLRNRALAPFPTEARTLTW